MVHPIKYTLHGRNLVLYLIIVCSGLSGLLTGCASATTPRAESSAATPAMTPNKTLGQFHPIPGTDYLRAPVVLESRSSGGFSSSGYTSSTTRNFVFVDSRDDTIRQLLPNNDSIITLYTGLSEKTDTDHASNTDDEDVPPVIGFLYSVLTTDTNGDEVLSEDDLQTLAISDVSGAGYTEVITGVQTLHGHTLTEGNILLIIYRQNEKIWLARIDLAARTVIKTIEFPSPGSDVR